MPSPLLIVGILLAISVAGNALLSKLYVGAKQDVAAITQKHNSFVAQVKVEGERSEAEAKARTAAEKLSKEQADAENKKSAAANAASIAELRHQRDSARRAFLSSSPPGSVCPDGQACFLKADFERAYGKLVADLRGIADQGTAVTIDLDTAKKWALSATPH